MLLVAVSGIGAGSLHVVSGPDHLAAVAPLAVSARRRAAWIGASWGLGHASGAALIGLGAILLGDRLPLRAMSAVAEQVVGALLIGLGVMRLVRLRHPHHDDAHAAGAPRTALHFGLFHGVAGSAHLFGILPTLLLPTLAGQLTFLACFGIGSALSMAGVAQALGSSRALVSPRHLVALASAASVCVGAVWIWRS